MGNGQVGDNSGTLTYSIEDFSNQELLATPLYEGDTATPRYRAAYLREFYVEQMRHVIYHGRGSWNSLPEAQERWFKTWITEGGSSPLRDFDKEVLAERIAA